MTAELGDEPSQGYLPPQRDPYTDPWIVECKTVGTEAENVVVSETRRPVVEQECILSVRKSSVCMVELLNRKTIAADIDRLALPFLVDRQGKSVKGIVLVTTDASRFTSMHP